MDYGIQLPEARVQSSTALTNHELVAAVTAKQVHVASLFLMVDTAMIVTLKSGRETLKFQAYPAASSGLDLAFVGGQFRFSTDVGESLTVTSSTDGEIFVLVSYDIGVGA